MQLSWMFLAIFLSVIEHNLSPCEDFIRSQILESCEVVALGRGRTIQQWVCYIPDSPLQVLIARCRIQVSSGKTAFFLGTQLYSWLLWGVDGCRKVAIAECVQGNTNSLLPGRWPPSSPHILSVSPWDLLSLPLKWRNGRKCWHPTTTRIWPDFLSQIGNENNTKCHLKLTVLKRHLSPL